MKSSSVLLKGVLQGKSTMLVFGGGGGDKYFIGQYGGLYELSLAFCPIDFMLTHYSKWNLFYTFQTPANEHDPFNNTYIFFYESLVINIPRTLEGY